MADRYGMTQVRSAFGVWLQSIGGIETEIARARGESLVGTFRIENLTIHGEGRTRLRVVQIMNVHGGERAVLGERHCNARELVAVLRAGTDTVDAYHRLRAS